MSQNNMEMKKQIIGWVREIGELNAQIADHWIMAQKSISEGEVDHAIALLNAHFRLKEKLGGVEAQLKGILKGYFSDK